MGIFDKIKEPIFLKEDSSAESQLLALQTLAQSASSTLSTLKLWIKMLQLNSGIIRSELPVDAFLDLVAVRFPSR